MDRTRKEQADHGDQQDANVGPAEEGEQKPGRHSDAPPSRAERVTGAGGEATEGTGKTGEEHEREHRSGYGGAGGAPVTSSDTRE